MVYNDDTADQLKRLVFHSLCLSLSLSQYIDTHA